MSEMHEWAKLMESFNADEVVYSEWFEEFGEWVGEGMGLEEDELDSMESMFDTRLEQLWEMDGRTIYRGMFVPHSFLADLKSGKATVNVHWTYDRDVALRFVMEGKAMASHGGVGIVLESKIDLTKVNMAKTVALMMIDYEEEAEIRLKERAKIHIDAFTIFEDEDAVNANRGIRTEMATWVSTGDQLREALNPKHTKQIVPIIGQYVSALAYNTTGIVIALLVRTNRWPYYTQCKRDKATYAAVAMATHGGMVNIFPIPVSELGLRDKHYPEAETMRRRSDINRGIPDLNQNDRITLYRVLEK